MSVGKRIGNIISGILEILSGLVIMLFPQQGFITIVGILSISLTLYGIRTLIYYFKMARHMVGGKYMLILGIIALDFGVFTLSLTTVPPIYIVLYLLFIHLFAGVVDILRSFESKRLTAHYRLTLFTGILNIIIGLLCIIYIRNTTVLVFIYGVGLIVSAFARIAKALRRTAIVYIQ